VIRGHDPQRFRREVQEAYAGMYPQLREVSPPALFVTDLPPARLQEPEPAGRFMIFPLRGFRREDGSVADFLSSLADALADPEAMAALEPSPRGLFERRWRWLNRYLTMRPAPPRVGSAPSTAPTCWRKASKAASRAAASPSST
jgi:hypothetical protein